MSVVVVAVAVRIRILQDSSTIHERLVGVGDEVGVGRCLDVGRLSRKNRKRERGEE